MFRMSGHQNGNTFDMWLFEDNGFFNDSSQWTDLLEGANSVVVEFARTDANGQPQGNWGSYTVNFNRFGGVRKNLRSTLTPQLRGDAWSLRFVIDGITYGPVCVRWAA